MKQMIKHAIIVIAMLTPLDGIANAHSHSNTHTQLKHKHDKKVAKTKRNKVNIDKRNIKSKKRYAKNIKTVETGKASWYGKQFLGRKTASGERFNTQELTAAHLSLPFGTKLLVRNERNGKEVVVRVNDRGPYIKTRIIDLSQAAARALGIDGIGKVVIQRLENDSNARKRYRSAD